MILVDPLTTHSSAGCLATQVQWSDAATKELRRTKGRGGGVMPGNSRCLDLRDVDQAIYNNNWASTSGVVVYNI